MNYLLKISQLIFYYSFFCKRLKISQKIII